MGGDKKFFDFVLVVELQEEQDGKTAPFISFRHPQLFESDPFSASVTQFCFPDINQFPTEHMPSETFTFVLTDSEGDRRFGYCRRQLPLGAGPRFPVAFTIMTYFPCFQLYSKVLEQVAYHYENSSMSMLKLFLESVLETEFPKPGASFEVKMETSGSQMQHSRFTRPDDSDSQLEHVDLDTLLLVLDPMNILSVFASLLLERRTIFCSTKLSTLSSCVQTAVALLYPFTWQHIYIPVLPKSLLSFCCAPMPFVVGILASELKEVLTLPMDEVLIIDLDSNSFIRTPAPTSDVELLPPNYIEQLRKCLRSTSKLVKKHRKKRKESAGPARDLEEKKLGYEMKKQTVELMDTFLQFFVCILGSYKQFIKNDEFDKDAFMASQAPDTQTFMEMFVGSQLFQMFIEERLTTEFAGGFEKKIEQFEMLSGELRRHFGDEVADSMSLSNLDSTRRSQRPVSKRKFADKSGALFSTLRRGLANKSGSESGVDGSLISTPTLVQSTNVRVETKQPAALPPAASSAALPAFVVPKKPLPRPPGRNSMPTGVVAAISNSTPIRRPPARSHATAPSSAPSSADASSPERAEAPAPAPRPRLPPPSSGGAGGPAPGSLPVSQSQPEIRRSGSLRGRGTRGRGRAAPAGGPAVPPPRGSIPAPRGARGVRGTSPARGRHSGSGPAPLRRPAPTPGGPDRHNGGANSTGGGGGGGGPPPMPNRGPTPTGRPLPPRRQKPPGP
mmetsp:Transcript_18400/g.71098  ORF Transcript_18400/g.71098 Transcript_18400/m.71098 type:complete len:729 (-) Transcript_18400:243-2429(-)